MTTMTGRRFFGLSVFDGFAGGSRIKNSEPATKIGALGAAGTACVKRLAGCSPCAIKPEVMAKVRLVAANNAGLRFMI